MLHSTGMVFGTFGTFLGSKVGDKYLSQAVWIKLVPTVGQAHCFLSLAPGELNAEGKWLTGRLQKNDCGWAWMGFLTGPCPLGWAGLKWDG